MGLGRLDDCIKTGHIRRIEPSRETAKRIVAKAGVILDEAAKSLDSGVLDGSLLMSYETMLLSGKALLAKDGFREKNHYCVVVYVQEAYADKGKISNEAVELFDHYREVRHMVAYAPDFFATESDAKEALRNASRFLSEVKKLV